MAFWATVARTAMIVSKAARVVTAMVPLAPLVMLVKPVDLAGSVLTVAKDLLVHVVFIATIVMRAVLTKDAPKKTNYILIFVFKHLLPLKQHLINIHIADS